VGRETNKQRRERQASTAREKAAEARALQQRKEQRRRAKVVLSSVVAAAVVIGLITLVAINSGGNEKNSTDRPIAQDAIVKSVTDITPATYDEIGQGGVNLDAVKAVNDPPLEADGKPKLLFVGGEFCPFCAAERWSLVAALSRFGTFSDLKQIRSAVNDGDLATFSFYKSSYESKYLTFTPIEYSDRNHAQLESIGKEDEKLWLKYTGQGSFPFMAYGGKFIQTQVGFDDKDLSGLSWSDIADALKDPNSQVAKDIVGEANAITAMICKMTNGQPADVCSASSVTSINLPSA
jgi:hypothetical protein